jgi:hypothetical protein
MPSKRMVPEQEIDQCPACFWHPGHEPDEWFREEVRLRSSPSLPESLSEC